VCPRRPAFRGTVEMKRYEGPVVGLPLREHINSFMAKVTPHFPPHNVIGSCEEIPVVFRCSRIKKIKLN
jgi:hypothetical protein